MVKMYLGIGALLSWAMTAACSLNAPFNHYETTHYKTLLQRFRHCNVTIVNGHLNAICKILVGLQLRPKLIPTKPEILTMEQLLVSDERVDGIKPEHRIFNLSLHSVKIKKWDNFPLKMAADYDQFLTTEDSDFGPFSTYSLLVYIRQMTLNITFRKPPQVAAGICNVSLADGRCHFDVYGFVDRYRHNFTYGPTIEKIFEFISYWNIAFASAEFLNITFIDTVTLIPVKLFRIFAVMPVRHFVFYKCNFDSIGFNMIPRLRNLERLDFFQTPIQAIAEFAFDLNPDFRQASFVGTKLSGFPKAIFNLKRLETLDMSYTDVPRDVKFQYFPKNCRQNSTAKMLIMRGTNLMSLPNRAFCGFPLLKSLQLENCNITMLSGSPFECLLGLRILSLLENKIQFLHGESVKGLRSLAVLNLKNNRVTRFEGPKIFSTLVSLSTLVLSHNLIEELQLGPVEYVPVKQIQLAYNRISTWKPPLFSRMRTLNALQLEHNMLPKLGDDLLHDLKHVKFVNLGWNPWDCSTCQLGNLLSMMKRHPAVCSSCFFCKEPDSMEGKLVLEVPWNEDQCSPPDPYQVYGIPTLFSIMIGSLVGYAVYANRWYCMYGLLYLKVAMKGYRRQTHAGRFLWDGFLSYHASDNEWVRDELLPKLESAPMRFRLCVAERDFIPGLPITENICRAITQSRVSLFVLSREFCRSRWCMFELSLAQHRLFESDRSDGMVFIKKNDVEESEMSSMLVYLTKSRTYVQLPPDRSSEALNNLFWLQLQAALEQ